MGFDVCSRKVHDRSIAWLTSRGHGAGPTSGRLHRVRLCHIKVLSLAEKDSGRSQHQES
jgi:hypothetical protein